MRFHGIIVLFCIFTLCFSWGANGQSAVTPQDSYLDSLKSELVRKWPTNRTVNLVFHGHSVPAGYFKTPMINSFESYPFVTLQLIKDQYPFALVNSIVTAKGGENSEQGAARFENEVLNHRPDVVFIDYALNDRRIGLERAKAAWIKMIEMALNKNVKIVLLTPTPDLKETINDETNLLAKHSIQIRALSKFYSVPVVDSYRMFQEISTNQILESYMSQGNHINAKGHFLVAAEISLLFLSNN